MSKLPAQFLLVESSQQILEKVLSTIVLPTEIERCDKNCEHEYRNLEETINFEKKKRNNLKQKSNNNNDNRINNNNNKLSQ